jgi:hypothetical protein
MHWSDIMRHLSMLAAGPALLLATACGGDKSPTGPGNNGIAGTYDLVALSGTGLPADVQVEDCGVIRFYNGGLQLQEDGSWQLQMQVEDANGAGPYLDRGVIDQEDGDLWFDSEISGTSYEARHEGGEIRILYDWCYDGATPDVLLVFDR